MARGRIRDEDIERLRERVDIVEVISDYVQLKKAGRLFKGLCPFHDEKTPSFMVDPAKQLYHCFGCGEGGNVFTFLRKKEGLEFREAVEKLASRVGLTLHYQGGGREAAGVESRRARLYRVNQWAADAYHRVLTEGEAGRKAREYLASRGIGEEAVRQFKLGYAPARWDFLYRQALRSGFEAADFLAVGLGLQGEKGTYDRFRDRVIFPIQDLQDRVVAFGGRTLGDAQPKYLNSPETAIYVKSRHLYALNLARREIVSQGYAILVEGYTDVISLWQAGVRNAVATLGTALGEEHLRLLSRLTQRVILAFDADRAGIGASERGLDFYGDFDLDLRVMLLSEGMDPADFVAAEGPEEFLGRVERSVPLVDFCVGKALREHDPADTNSRLRGVRRAVHLVAGLGRDIDHERHIKEIADWAGSGYQAVYELYERARGGKTGAATVAERNIAVPPQLRAERELLRLLLHHPYMVPREGEGIDPALFEDPDSRDILEALLEASREHRVEGEREQDAGAAGPGGAAGEGPGGAAGEGPAGAWERLVAAAVERLPSERARNAATSLIFDESGNLGSMGAEEARVMYNDLLASLKELYFERQIRRLKKELETLSSAPRRDHEREQELSEEIYALERLKRQVR
ncbi:MAG: DNA primase [Actinobacteria bacterium]|nr:DNA primase [Actinomycetota bacterium]